MNVDYFRMFNQKISLAHYWHILSPINFYISNNPNIRVFTEEISMNKSSTTHDFIDS